MVSKPLEYYPHWLTVTADASVAVYNETTGEWEETANTAKPKKYKCRAQSSTSNAYLTGITGERIDYQWIVYLPLDAPIITQGKSVTISDGQTILATDTVKRYFKSQLHTRIWL